MQGFVAWVFGPIGAYIGKMCGDLEAADIRIHPSTYGSMIVLAAIATAIISVGLTNVKEETAYL